ncbi:MAG: DUF4296 domain-containing protein, partial [Bacteroidota bacterium]|nr:DUF4296 domain-containing protein [Bacteroidota bacterium]
CNNSPTKEYSKPSIGEKTMINILLDMSKAERMTMQNVKDRKEKDSLMQAYKQSILQHYGVSSKDYENSLKTYLANPKQMQKLSKHIKK